MGISIRQWRLSDAKDLAAALSNQKVLNNLRDGLPYPYTDQDAHDYIRAVLSADPDQTFAYAVCVDDKVVGSIGAFRQENIHRRTAELGYYLSEAYWGQGIMTQAVGMLCAGCFPKRIFCGSTLSLLPLTWVQDGYWKRQDFSLRASSAAMPARMVRSWIWRCMD